jgi:flagellar hook assembly protein FlgD
VRGRQVRRFTIDPAAGTHEVLWNGTDDTGATVASGVYVTRFVCGDEEVTRRMTMLK